MATWPIENPVIAPILPRALGDFVEHSIGACLYVDQEYGDTYHLVAMYVNDRPWKEPWLRRLHRIESTVTMEQPTPIEFFDMAARPRVSIPTAWAQANLWDPAGFIVPRSMNRGAVNHMLSCGGGKVSARHTPSADEGRYVVVHWNATGYEGRPDDPDRSLSEAYTTPLVEYMEREFEVPVVVIGHQNPKKRSFEEEIDLIANAWCVVELSPSGPAAISMAYGVPWLRLNCILKRYSGDDKIVRQYNQHCDVENWWDRSDVLKAGGTFTKMSHEEMKSAINEFRVEFKHMKRR